MYKFFKDFTNYRKKTNRVVVFSFKTFLNTGTTNETFQQSGKQDSFRHIWVSSASMYESSGLQFFKTTTGIQSGPDVFYESRFIMTFLTILGVMGIYSFRLVLEGKICKEIPESSRLEFLEKFSADNLALSDTEVNTTGSLNRGGIADLLLLRTLFISNLPKVLRVKFLGSDGLFCFSSISFEVWKLQKPFCIDC